MFDKEDKDGIIAFLKERLETIKKMAEDGEHWYGYGYGQKYLSVVDEIADLCDHALMDVSF